MPCVEAPGSGPGRRMARGRHGLGPGRLARRGCRDDAAPGAAGVGRGGGAGWRMVFINPWLIIYENKGLLMINNLDNNG